MERGDMRTHRWRAAAPFAALALLVGACSSDEDAQADDGIQPIASDDSEAEDDPEPDPEPELEPEPEEEPQPEPEPEPEPDPEIDITVIPDEITEEYVDAVLLELNRIYAEAFELARDEREFNVDIADRIASIFDEESVPLRYDEMQQLAEQPERVVSADEFGPVVSTVVDLLEVTDSCMWLEVESDSRGVSASSDGPTPLFVLLREKVVERPVDHNPTPWVFASLRGGDLDGLRQEQRCSA
jgi:hypothetical protein